MSALWSNGEGWDEEFDLERELELLAPEELELELELLVLLDFVVDIGHTSLVPIREE